MLHDKQGRYTAVQGLMNGEPVTVASIYALNTAQITFLEQTLQKITDFGDGTMIVAGDYNYILDLKLDWSYTPRDVQVIQHSSFSALQKLLGNGGGH